MQVRGNSPSASACRSSCAALPCKLPPGQVERKVAVGRSDAGVARSTARRPPKRLHLPLPRPVPPAHRLPRPPTLPHRRHRLVISRTRNGSDCPRPRPSPSPSPASPPTIPARPMRPALAPATTPRLPLHRSTQRLVPVQAPPLPPPPAGRAGAPLPVHISPPAPSLPAVASPLVAPSAPAASSAAPSACGCPCAAHRRAPGRGLAVLVVALVLRPEAVPAQCEHKVWE